MMIPVWLTDTMTGDLGRSVRYTLLWGLEGVVLRQMERGARVPDVNESKLISRLADVELTVAAVDPGIFEVGPEERAVWLNDLERLEETAAFCRRIGCTRILSGDLPGASPEAAADVFGRAAGRVSRYDVRLCVRNQAAARPLLAVIAAVGVDALRLAWDPAQALASSQEAPLDVVGEIETRTGMVFVRDVRAGAPGLEPTRLGDGELPWAELIEALGRAGSDAPLCLEFDNASSAEALRDSTALIGMIRAATRR